MKKLLASAIIALLPATGMSATILGFQVGAGTWNHAPVGDFTADVGGAGTSANLKDDLNLTTKGEGYYYFQIEHPVPLVPNLKYISTKLSSTGSGTATSSFNFNGTTYATNVNLDTSLVLDQTDTILYYEILDNSLTTLDVGISLKDIKGSASVNSNPKSFNAMIPMLYAYAEIGLPLSGLSIAGEIQALGLDKNSVTDITAKIMYEMDSGLGLEAGLRSQSYKLDVDSVTASMTFTGIFAGAYYRF